MVQQYAPPINVSPFIRFCRWSLLLAGIGYGAFWNSRYTKYETKMKPIWDKEKAEHEAHLKEENIRKSAEEIENLQKLF